MVLLIIAKMVWTGFYKILFFFDGKITLFRNNAKILSPTQMFYDFKKLLKYFFTKMKRNYILELDVREISNYSNKSNRNQITSKNYAGFRQSYKANLVFNSLLVQFFNLDWNTQLI